MSFSAEGCGAESRRYLAIGHGHAAIDLSPSCGGVVIEDMSRTVITAAVLLLTIVADVRRGIPQDKSFFFILVRASGK
jgi:hypothetical protein